MIWYMTPNVLEEKNELLRPFSEHVVWALRGALLELNRHAIDGRTATVVWESLCS
jgi:hypothetical protein